MNYLVVSDLHGMVPENLESLSQTFKGPVVFLGDIVGTTYLDQLQKLFYNGVYNPVKKLLAANPKPCLQDITLFPIDDSRILYDGFHSLVSFLGQLGTFQVGMFSQFVLNIARYTHFGHFVSNLPLEIRQALQQDMEANAQKIIDLMTNFTARGQDVYVIEGNWDARTPLDFYPTEECKPLPIDQRSFYFKKFLLERNPKVHYFDTVSTVNDGKHVLVFWPFDCSTNYAQVPEINREDIAGNIILFSHAQVDWQSVKGDTPMTAEGAKVQKVMAQVVSDLKPDLIYHGHLHDDKPSYTYQGIPVAYCPLLSIQILTLD